MVLLAWGMNYQTAPLKIREKLAVTKDQAKLLLQELVLAKLVREAVIVSTCNRTELYTETLTEQKEALFSFVANTFNQQYEALKPYSYCYENEAAVQHLMKVASGLNSMILGEGEILGQLKQAFLLAKETKTLGKSLHRLFQHTFYVAKKVRTKTHIDIKPRSVASTAVTLAERIFTDMSKSTVLFVGAGEIIFKTAMHLKKRKVEKFIIANRNAITRRKFAEEFQAEDIPLEWIPDRLHEADIIITGTDSPLPLIGKGMVEQALHRRKRRPQLMIDLAVPRDIEPQVNDLEDIYLYCIDDLLPLVEENSKIRETAGKMAEQMIILESESFMNWYHAQESLAALKAFRTKYEQMSDKLLAEATQQLNNGKTPEEVLKRYSAMLFNRLMHPPTRRLRKAGFQNEASFLQFTRELFDLNHEIINT